MWLDKTVNEDTYVPRAERVSFDMLVRYRREGTRATMLLKNLNCNGARVEGLAGLKFGDTITVMLPSLAPKEARVVWIDGMAAGLEFDRPLHPDIFETLVLHHGQWRERNDTDRLVRTAPPINPSAHAPTAFPRRAA